MTNTILMKRGMCEVEYGVSRHHLEVAVKEGRLVPYGGRAKKKWAQFFRVDVAKLADGLGSVDSRGENTGK